MRDAVLQLRAELFFDINERLRKLADYLVTAGAPEELQRRNPGALLPGLKTVAGVLRVSASGLWSGKLTGWGSARIAIGSPQGCRWPAVNKRGKNIYAALLSQVK